METVGKLTRLQSLDLDYTRVSDAGFAKLSGLTALVSLQLDDADLTDAGVTHVAALRNLKQLDLYHTLVTEKGFAQLKTALPSCEIHYERDSTRRERRSS